MRVASFVWTIKMSLHIDLHKLEVSSPKGWDISLMLTDLLHIFTWDLAFLIPYCFGG